MIDGITKKISSGFNWLHMLGWAVALLFIAIAGGNYNPKLNLLSAILAIGGAIAGFFSEQHLSNNRITAAASVSLPLLILPFLQPNLFSPDISILLSLLVMSGFLFAGLLRKYWPGEQRYSYLLLMISWGIMITIISLTGVTRLLEPMMVVPPANSDSEYNYNAFGELEIKTLEGEVWDSRAVSGKVLVLDFWATWCAPCLVQLPALQAVHERYENNPNVLVFGIILEEKRMMPRIVAFNENKGYSFPMAFDTFHRMATRFGADKIPHTVIIDKKGVVRDEHTGLKESNDDFVNTLNTQIEKLLKEDSPK